MNLVRPSVKRLVRPVVALSLVLGLSSAAHATFHLMQIEQVIGGVSGHADAQAIQLRMRSSGQGIVSEARLVVRDAAGANPVTLIDFAEDVDNAQAGARILIATPAFSEYTIPAAEPDFVMAAIPSSYLAAGSLIFEDKSNDAVLWRLSWGGAGYT